METKHLYKSNTDKAVFGVCGGIAEYFGIDSLIVRLIFVLFCLAYGSGLLIYVIAALVIPKKPEYYQGGYASAQDPYSAASNYGYQNEQRRAPYDGQSPYSAGQSGQSRAAGADYTYRSAPTQAHYGAGVAPAEAPSSAAPAAAAAAAVSAAPAPSSEGAQAVREAADASRAAMEQLSEQLRAAEESQSAPAAPADAPDAEYDDVDAVTSDTAKVVMGEVVGQEEPQAPKAEPEQPKAAPEAPKNDGPAAYYHSADRYDRFQAYAGTAPDQGAARQGAPGGQGGGVFGGQGGQGGQPGRAGQPGQPGQPAARNANGRKWIGLVLVLLGGLLIFRVLFPVIDMRLVWGGAAVLSGLILLLSKK